MKTIKNVTTQNAGKSGFSLIELMTVISIMAILAAVAMPGLRMVNMNGEMSRAAQNARNIALGLRTYSQDFDGLFPYASPEDDSENASTSNEIFRLLVPDYIDSEGVFAVGRSAWGRQADGRIDQPEDRLEAGENHFAYIAGLTNTSRSDWPLVVDGTNGSGSYTKEYGQKGGCWEGRKAVVVRVGGSAETVKLMGDDDERYIPRIGYPEENALDVNSYMGELAQLLDPE